MILFLFTIILFSIIIFLIKRKEELYMKDFFTIWDMIDNYKLGYNLMLASNHVISYEKVAFDTLSNELFKNYLKSLYGIK